MLEKKENTHRISGVRPGSIAEEAGILPGDVLLKAGGQELNDIFDYYYYEENGDLELLILHEDGEEQIYYIEKDEGEDVGLTFENGLLDNYRSCHNGCVFCFIDQMPKGMRETLYFKDDDTRLSYLQGNYVTLTNMKEEDLQRVIDYRLAPINISVHTTDPALRVKMLHNRFAGDILEKISRIAEADLPMNSQVVLCKGLNDGGQLDKTIGDLLSFYPQMQSLSIVPVGLTKFREGLYPLESFNREDAREVVGIIKKWQNIAYEKYGTHFVQASDEWYLLGELPLPEEEVYDGYIQLENGVGMIRLLLTEFAEALAKEGPHPFKKEHLTVATGVLAKPFIQMMAEDFMRKYPRYQIDVVAIINHYFGEKITVSGLITGKDLTEQINALPDKGGRVLIPQNMLRSGEEVMLDDMTLTQVQDSLQVPVTVVKSSGQDLLNAFLGRKQTS